jgi:hypothetical protein
VPGREISGTPDTQGFARLQRVVRTLSFRA